MQRTDSILMVRPAHFGYNSETAKDNFFQRNDDLSGPEIQAQALREFDGFVALLRDQGVSVVVIEDTVSPAKPDAVFVNNWISTHSDGKLILYPICSPSRRQERRKDIVEQLINCNYRVDEILDLSFFEESGQFLESTGSMVMDHESKLIFASFSERTHRVPLDYIAKLLGYKVVGFHAEQEVNGKFLPVYHTNVLMHIGSDLAVVCLDSIRKTSERRKVQEALTKSGKKVVPITIKQKANFAGNMLEVSNDGGERFTVMSQAAFDTLNVGQIQQIEKHSTIISPSLPTIEKLGGGSARCMMAEIFLPRSG
jgi:hypothetical protein